MSIKNVVYSTSQIDTFLCRISFPKDVTLPTPENATSAYGLEYVTRLQKYTMQACPFENLNMHYAASVIKSLEPADLYEKIVIKKWGGTCTEMNSFFGSMLKSMGFKVRPVGARVHRSVARAGEEGYNGWNHCINLVTFDERKYLVDVAMGPTAPVQPLLLEDMYTAPGIGATTSRIRYDTIPEYTDPDSKLWIYEQAIDGKSDFAPISCFTELEFLRQDYEVMKHATTFNTKSWFTYRIICVRTILESEEVVGMLILTNETLKRRIRGKTEHLATFTCEAERVESLSEWFGIEMTEEDRLGIRSTATDLGNGR